MTSINEFKRWVYLFDEPTGLPTKKRVTDAAYDIVAHEPFTIEPGQLLIYVTNVAIEIKIGEYGQLAIRYTYAHKGLMLAATIIDSTFTGPLRAVLYNVSNAPLTIKKYDKFLAIVIAPISKTYPIYEIDKTTHEKHTKASLRGAYTSYHNDKPN